MNKDQDIIVQNENEKNFTIIKNGFNFKKVPFCDLMSNFLRGPICQNLKLCELFHYMYDELQISTGLTRSFILDHYITANEFVYYLVGIFETVPNDKPTKFCFWGAFQDYMMSPNSMVVFEIRENLRTNVVEEVLSHRRYIGMKVSMDYRNITDVFVIVLHSDIKTKDVYMKVIESMEQGKLIEKCPIDNFNSIVLGSFYVSWTLLCEIAKNAQYFNSYQNFVAKGNLIYFF